MPNLTVAFDGTDRPVADLVCIPRLPQNQGKSGTQHCDAWLGDISIIQHRFPKLRTITFQYTFGDTTTSYDWENLFANTSELLDQLLKLRSDTHCAKIPLLFIGCGVGSLLLKNSLVLARSRGDFREIFNRTAAVFFSGCLHDTNHPDFRDSLHKCVRVELDTIRSKRATAADALNQDEAFLAVKFYLDEFNALPLNLAIRMRTFYETKPTIWFSRPLLKNKESILCPENLSRGPWNSNQPMPCDTNHLETMKFPSRTSAHFSTVLGEIQTVYEQCNVSDQQSCSSGSGPNVDDTSSVDSGPATLNIHNLAVGGLTPSGSSIMSDCDSVFGHNRVQLPCRYYQPYERNVMFKGRKEVLERLRKDLLMDPSSPCAQRVVTISGLGGIGKTQTALAFMFNNMDSFEVVCWVPASDRAKLIERYLQFAIQLGLISDVTVEQGEAILKLKNWLESTDVPWLMIFDNADGQDAQEILGEYMPRGDRGSVLITSRQQWFREQFGGLTLQKLEEETAISLLLHLTAGSYQTSGNDEALRRAALKLADTIDYLPLGIHVIAKLVMKSRTSLEKFAEAYRARDVVEDSSETRPFKDVRNYPHTLLTVWKAGFDSLDADQKLLLGILAFIDPDRVQHEVLEQGQSNPALFNYAPLAKHRKLYRARMGLLENSIVDANEQTGELRIHRLVQTFCQVYMSELHIAQEAFDAAFALVENIFPVTPVNERHNKVYWTGQQAYISHVQRLASNYDELKSSGTPLKVDAGKFCALLHNAAWYFYERGIFEPAFPLLDIAESVIIEHPGEITNSLSAAVVYVRACLGTECNKFEEAYEYFSKHLDYLEKGLQTGELKRPCLPEVFAFGGVGNGLQGLHKYAEAEKFYQRSMEAYRAVGNDLSAVSVVPTNLATCLWLQKRYDEAERLLGTIIKNANDVTNYRTGHALFALGNVQISIGQDLLQRGKSNEGQTKLEEAYQTHVRTLRQFITTLGKSHHKVGDAAHKIGCHLERKRDYANAESMLNDAIDIYKKSPFLRNELARSRYKLGCIFQNSGDVARGLVEIQEAESIRKEILGDQWSKANGEEDFDRLVMFWSR